MDDDDNDNDNDTTNYFTPCACAQGNKWGSTAYYANYYKISVNQDLQTIIIESVDSISRDGPDMYIYVIHYKIPNISERVNFKDF